MADDNPIQFPPGEIDGNAAQAFLSGHQLLLDPVNDPNKPQQPGQQNFQIKTLMGGKLVGQVFDDGGKWRFSKPDASQATPASAQSNATPAEGATLDMDTTSSAPPAAASVQLSAPAPAVPSVPATRAGTNFGQQVVALENKAAGWLGALRPVAAASVAQPASPAPEPVPAQPAPPATAAPSADSPHDGHDGVQIAPPPSTKGNASIDLNAVKEKPSWEAIQEALKTTGAPKEKMQAVQGVLMKSGYVIKGGADGLYGQSTQAALTDYLGKTGQDQMAENIKNQQVFENPGDHFAGQTGNAMNILDGQPSSPTYAHNLHHGSMRGDHRAVHHIAHPHHFAHSHPSHMG